MCLTYHKEMKVHVVSPSSVLVIMQYAVVETTLKVQKVLW